MLSNKEIPNDAVNMTHETRYEARLNLEVHPKEMFQCFYAALSVCQRQLNFNLTPSLCLKRARGHFSTKRSIFREEVKNR